LLQGESPRRDAARPSIRQPNAIIIAVGALVIFLVCLGAYLAIHESRLRDMNDEERELTALDLLLEEETERTLQSVDLVLTSLQDDLIFDGISRGQEFVRR